MTAPIPFVVTVDPCHVPNVDMMYVREQSLNVVTEVLARRGITLDPDGDDAINEAFGEALVALWTMADAVQNLETYAAQWVTGVFASLFHTGALNNLLTADTPQDFATRMYEVVASVTQSLMVVLVSAGAAASVMPTNEEYALPDNEENRCVEFGVSFNDTDFVKSLVLDENFLDNFDEEDAWDRFYGDRDE